MFATFDLSLSFQRSVFSGDLHSISARDSFAGHCSQPTQDVEH
jgi:hypothetical protein